jgi:hypothetical protein
MKQGFNRNVRVEFLRFEDKVSYETLEAFKSYYHIEEIPHKYFTEKGKYAILIDSFAYIDGSGRRHYIKRGLITDGGSIGRIIRVVMGNPFRSPYLHGFVAHDMYCQRARDIGGVWNKERRRLRKSADVLFLEMVTFLGASLAKRQAFYRGVRFGSLWC